MLILTIIGVLLLSSVLSLIVQRSITSLGTIAVAAALVQLAVSLLIVVEVFRNGAYRFTEFFFVDPLAAVLISILSVVGAMVSCYSVGYLAEEITKGVIGFRRMRQYFTFLPLFLGTMFFAITTSSPILMWIAIEATTLSTAFLISFYNKPSSIEAAWKYLLINSVGLLAALFGTLLFLAPSIQAGFAGFTFWSSLLAGVSGADPVLLKMAFVFTLIGYGTKVGFVPMHTWLPDAHGKAPAPISALLSGVLLNVAFFGVLRYKTVVDAGLGPAFSGELLIVFGLLSVIVPACIMLVQKNYKRLLAYSSIEHMGIIALGFGFGGIGAFAALLHMVYHSLAKSMMFLSSGTFFLTFSSTKIREVRGALRALPVTGTLFIIGFLALAGVPPFGIFLTEFAILSAGMQHYSAIVFIVLGALTLVFVGFLRHVVSMSYGETSGAVQGERGWWTVAPVVTLAALLVLLSVYVPAELQTLIQKAVSP